MVSSWWSLCSSSYKRLSQHLAEKMSLTVALHRFEISPMLQFLVSGNVCCQKLITFANSLDPDQK